MVQGGEMSAPVHRHVTSGLGVPPAGAPYSAAVVANSTCYVSGQIALDMNGVLSGGAIEHEAPIALSNVLAILQSAGFAAADVVSVTVLLADINDFAAFNSIYGHFWDTGRFPARIAYQVAALPMGARVEVQAIAVRNPQDADSVQSISEPRPE